mgnify:FL=1
MEKYSFNTIIIGSGIAGMTASIYLKRANISVLLIEKNVPGGQITRASSVENYPGFKQIDGASLAMNVFEQVQNLGIDIKFADVKKIELVDDKKIVKTKNEEFICDNIIVATGRNPRELLLPHEKELIGHGISYCALCDGSFYKDKDVAIVGGGNSALGEALYLSNICHKVYLIHRRDEYRAASNLINTVKEKQNIELITNSNITKLNEKDGYLNSIIINDNKQINVSCVFIYIGNTPDISFLDNLNLTTKDDYIIVNNDMETNIKGIYACGDVIYKNTYQLTTAVGEATVAANSIIKQGNM